MRRMLLIFAMLLLGSSPRAALGEIERVITSNRVLLGVLVPSAPAEIADLDLGPAPPAGSSRLYSSSELSYAAQQGGKTLLVPDSVRAVRATKRWSQAEFSSFVTPKLKATLPNYARLVHVDVPRTLLTVQNVELNRIEWGQLPNRRGTVHTSALAELSADGKVEQRLTLAVVLDLSDRPKPVEVAHGSSVALHINLGSTRVSAAAITLQALPVGGVGLFRVIKTRKTLRAKLLSPSTAEVVSE